MSQLFDVNADADIDIPMSMLPNGHSLSPFYKLLFFIFIFYYTYI